MVGGIWAAQAAAGPPGLRMGQETYLTPEMGRHTQGSGWRLYVRIKYLLRVQQQSINK